MMDKKTTQKKKSPMRRLSALLVLVLLIFTILLLSYALAGITLFVLMRIGAIAQIGERNFVPILLFMLLTSLGIGTIFSTVGGTFFLRPLRRLIDATKEIAAGKFDTQVEPIGPYEMQRLTKSFNEMARELGSIETLRSDFVSNVSHEFKTPVASIRGFARLLKRDTLTAEQRNEYLDIILLEADRLTQLSSNVLLLSNLDSTEHLPAATAFSLDEQLRQTVLPLAPQMDKQGLEVEIDCDEVEIVGSEELLRHVWLNLLQNAVKFTPDKGKISIRVTATETTATVTIADTGIGMSEEVQKRMFDRFYQGDTSHATQGNGLGMSLVQRIMTLIRGEIQLQSKENEGSVFTVILPRGEGR